jgi:hypothetical protein
MSLQKGLSVLVRASERAEAHNMQRWWAATFHIYSRVLPFCRAPHAHTHIACAAFFDRLRGLFQAHVCVLLPRFWRPFFSSRYYSSCTIHKFKGPIPRCLRLRPRTISNSKGEISPCLPVAGDTRTAVPQVSFPHSALVRIVKTHQRSRKAIPRRGFTKCFTKCLFISPDLDGNVVGRLKPINHRERQFRGVVGRARFASGSV